MVGEEVIPMLVGLYEKKGNRVYVIDKVIFLIRRGLSFPTKPQGFQNTRGLMETLSS
jgi:hypothetical protein